MASEKLLFWSYLLGSVLPWLGYGAGMVLGRLRLSLLRKPRDLPNPPPRVSIVIPAKDEEAGIAACVQSALDQDYPDLEVLVIDDRSGDGTGRILDEMAAGDRRLRVVHNQDGPPPGWTGKCNALHRHIGQATGQWLLLIDSDVVLRPDALRRSLALAAARNYGLLSLLLKLQSRTFWEGLLMPLCGGAIVGLYTVALANDENYPSIAFANGQYILLRRDAYEAMGGHEAVKDKLSEDVAMARLAKAKGLRPRVAWGIDQGAVRMYSSRAALVRGWARNFYGVGLGSPWRILMGMFFLLQCGFSLYPALGWAVWRLLHPGGTFLDWAVPAAAASHLALMTALLGIHYAWSGNRWWHALLFPVGAGMLIGIFLRALRLCVTGRVVWRGDQYAPAGP